MNHRPLWILPFGLFAAAACGGDDAEGDAAGAALTFHGEVNPLGDYSYDTGMQPAGSPVQVQFKFVSEAKLAADAQAVATEAPAIASKPGSGKLTLAAKFLLQANLKVDVSGLKYDGEVPGLDSIDISFAGEKAFDPFALEAPATVETSIPETKLPDIPLPGGLPGVLSLTITKDSVLSSAFQGTCAATDGKTATYRGGSVTTGSVVIQPTVILKLPIVGDKPFPLPAVTAPIPDLEAALDLGTVDVKGTAAAPANAEVIERKSCDAEEPGSSSGGSSGSSGGSSGSSGGSSGSSGGTSSGGPDGGKPPLACVSQFDVDTFIEGGPYLRLAVPNSCTDAQLDAFEAAAQDESSTDPAALFNSVPAGACRDCIFTEVADPEVVPAEVAGIVYVTGQGYSAMNGWCVASKIGDRECGRVAQSFQDCGRFACAECGTYDPETGGDADHQACQNEVYTDPQYVCAGSLGERYIAACGEAAIESAQAFCSQLNLLQAVRLLCGPQ